MSQATESSVRQRMRIAAIAAAGVAALLFVQDLIGNVSWIVVGYSQVEYNGDMFLADLWRSLGYGLIILLAFALGVFASLWLLAKVSATITVTQVVLRGLLAAGAGAILVLVVSFSFGMIGPMSGAGPMFGHSFPWPDLHDTVQAATMAAQAAVGAFVRQAPVVVLAVVLTWLWLQKHPSHQAVSTAAAEV